MDSLALSGSVGLKVFSVLFLFRDHGITKIASVVWIALVYLTALQTMMAPMETFIARAATISNLDPKFDPRMWTTKLLTQA